MKRGAARFHHLNSNSKWRGNLFGIITSFIASIVLWAFELATKIQLTSIEGRLVRKRYRKARCSGMSRSTTETRAWLLAGMLLIGSFAGCGVVRQRVEMPLAKVSFLSWNCTGARPQVCDQTLATSLDLLRLPTEQLNRLIQDANGPSPEEIDGAWLGINKGCGAAMAGWMQDIKVFKTVDGQRRGYNIAVHQVPIGRLECSGWRPKTKLLSNQPKTLGNFCVIEPKCDCQPLVLDYTLAGNPVYDPSHVLVDDLVVIQEDLILGKASAMVAGKKIGVAYFVLIKPKCDCYQ